MNQRAILLVVPFVAVVLSVSAFAQPRLQVEKPYGYQVGDKIEEAVTVFDNNLQPHSLVSLIKPGTKLVVLVGFGGFAAQTPQKRFRGPLWCEDSFDDLAVQRALVSAFRRSPVQFIGIAVPPVYNPVRYGYPENVFLGIPEDSAEFIASAKRFIEGTQEHINSGLIPLDQVYYDPRYRLAEKPTPGGPTWQGKLRWHLDPRKYGLPIIWLIGPKGEILQEPFFSNEYASDPPHIMYQFQDVKAAIEKYLE